MLGTAIEHLMNDNMSTVNNTDVAIQEYEIAAQEAELEMLEAENEMVEVEAELEMLNIDLTILEGTQKFIEEIGICKNLVELVDPTGILREHNVFPAVENLNDVPTKDENAQIAIEGIKEMLSKAWDAIKKFLKKIGDIFKKFFGAIVNATKSKEKLIVALEKKLDEIKGNVDVDKWKDKKITGRDKDFEKIKVEDAISTIKSKIGDIIKLCSADIETPENKESFIKNISDKVVGSTVILKSIVGSFKPDVTEGNITKELADNKTFEAKADVDITGQFLIGKKEAKLTVSTSSVSLSFASPVNKRFDKKDASSIAEANKAISKAKEVLRAAKQLAKDIYKLEQLKDMADKSLKVVVNAEKYAMKFADNDDDKAKYTLKMAQITRDINRIYINITTSVIKTINQVINTDIGFAKAVLSCIKEED